MELLIVPFMIRFSFSESTLFFTMRNGEIVAFCHPDHHTVQFDDLGEMHVKRNVREISHLFFH